MSDFGMSEQGFKRKRLDQIVQELNSDLRSVFGENLNLSPESPDGQVSGIISESYADLWQIAEEVYNVFNPSAATGVALSNLVLLNGITRLPATASTATVTCTGLESTVIPQGALVSTNDTGSQFSTDEEVTIPASGEIDVDVTATETGEVQALAGSITVIDTPIAGWDTVNNDEDATVGTDEETDVQLRARRDRSVALTSQSVIDSIVAGVLNVPGVTQLTVIENDTDATSSIGQPAHSFQTVVVGGDDELIADQIFVRKPVGIQAFGTTIIQVEDSQGIDHPIGFTRPDNIDIYVDVIIVKGTDYPSNGDDLIRQAIVDYANGELIPGRGFGLGDDVIQSRLYTPVNAVPEHDIEDIFIDTTPNPIVDDNIVINPDEVSRFLTQNIAVNGVLPT